jgi:two-component system heavy metal sensor histidine kinase CusS
VSFRSRLVVASSFVAALTLGGAFAAVSFAVAHSQRSQLDASLALEAKEEANEASALGGNELAILDGPGPYANDIGPLTKYGAIYAADGTIRDATSTFRCGVPARDSLTAPLGVPFDLMCGPEHLRGVVVAIPAHPRELLLLATPRTDLEANAAFLRRAMVIALVVAIGWSILISAWIVRRLTRDHQAIAEVARRVADGDLCARINVRSSDREMTQLSGDINEMIRRLGVLVDSQQRFIAHAAHELRSPLTTLYGELAHALRRERSSEEYRLAIAEALDSTRRLKSLANDLLALARIGAERDDDEVERVRLADVLSSVAHASRATAREREVVVAVQADDADLDGRPQDLERVVRNLVDNAIQHSPAGGTVRVQGFARDEDVEIAVTDDGPGVPAQDRELIFEPFHRAARDRASSSGAGLGLAIVREIVRNHGGEVRLDDSMSSTRFVATLPRRRERSRRSSPPSSNVHR